MNLLLNEKPCKILLAISKQNGKQGINTIGKEVYATYKSRYQTMVDLESVGFIKFERLGREVITWLTPNGEKAVNYIKKIMELEKW